jgi:hypothetical protein
LTRLQLAAIHEAGHVIAAHHCGFRVRSAWIHQITDGTRWGSGGFAEIDMHLLDDDPLTRQDLRRCLTVIMAGIAAELVYEPSLQGSPFPWSGHQDGATDSISSSGLPTDVTMAHSYVIHATPPIEARWVEREIMKGYRNACGILARRKPLIGTLADAIGEAYTNRETKLPEDRVVRLLAGGILDAI